MAGQCLILVVLSLLCMAFSFEISRTGMYDYTHVHVNRVTKHNNHEKPLLGYILSCFSMHVIFSTTIKLTHYEITYDIKSQKTLPLIVFLLWSCI